LQNLIQYCSDALESQICTALESEARSSDFPQRLSHWVPLINEQQDIVLYINMVNQKLDLQMMRATNVISRLVEYRSAFITNAVTKTIDVRAIPITLAATEG